MDWYLSGRNTSFGKAQAWLAAGMLACGLARAQSPTQSIRGPSHPTPLPLSGRDTQTAPVVVQQSTSQSSQPNSIDVLNSTVTVQGQYAGSAAMGKNTGGLMTLSLEQALAMGLKQNLGKLSEDANVKNAEGARGIAKSTLLPNVNVGGTEAFEKENLKSIGLKTNIIPEATTFNYYDARLLLQQTVVDLVRIHDLRAATESVHASMKAAQNARDLIVLAVGGSYLQLIALQARINSQAANVASAHAVFQQAADRFNAGLAARLDASRAQVQWQTEQQRLRSLQADFETEKLRLARLIGLPPGQSFIIGNEYHYAPLTEYTQDSALDRAFKRRNDLQAAASAVKAAESSVKAAHAERLPSVNISADIGVSGIAPTQNSIGVYTVTGTVTVPVYNGGHIRADVQQANAALTQRKAEYEDTRGQVDQDVRQAYINLNAASDQVGLAESNAALAHDTLTQSIDRFTVGVTDTVEVVQAEQTAVEADDEYITAVYEHNLGKLSLARAMGDAEETLPQLLRK